MKDIVGCRKGRKRVCRRREGIARGVVGKVEAGPALPDGSEGGVAGAGVKGVVKEAMELRGHESRGGVENKGDRGCVVRGVAEEDADASPILPFIMGVFGL